MTTTSRFVKCAPLGTTPQDKRHRERNRKLAWLCLWAEVGKYLNATSVQRRTEAEEGMAMYHDRLAAFGVVAPEPEGADAAL